MNTSKNEFLSAFLDDEAGEFERRRLLDELNRDDELGQTLSRYALVGEVMRGKQASMAGDKQQFLSGIHAALEDEPEYSETVVQFADESVAANDRQWRKSAMPFAMAASVAVAAIAGVLLLQSGETPVVDNGNIAANETQAAVSRPVQLSNATEPKAVAKPVTSSDAVGTERTLNLADSSRIRQSNKHLDWQTRDALKQYVTLHMQHRANNGIVPSIQAVSYSK
ncbi:MAG: sigma-E factor negative regulatory protein [Thiolinea sp.]